MCCRTIVPPRAKRLVEEMKGNKSRSRRKRRSEPRREITSGGTGKKRGEGKVETEGSSLPIRVPPQAFNHPIKRIFTYVN